MHKFNKFTGVVVPLDMAHVDTDQLVPKQFLKRTEREGFGEVLMYHHRFDEAGNEVDEFVMNRPHYKEANILLARENFGSGSSREHAPWALQDYGFRVLLAPSFADIFKNNCYKIGLLPIELETPLVDDLFKRVEANLGYRLTVDLKEQTLSGPGEFACFFAVDPFRKQCLLEGLDDIGLTLTHEQEIAEYEKEHAAPWQAAVSGGQQ
ncbi:MAG: 3-isopropylmalate dehydratase small subunit [Desulfarculaceae bacterium]|nr:3-isopropylmalate dehydratase small subunit [Desulfarculaceae bacterium]MCF8073693.1 3-isopropylmalate dehydratase small subunit [Desulfarculaceae bacterium]MCF8101934.1 3-isopropylmalate dehydratase small subunit [Desulfarculaceae bacterium]MCF8115904.1 3-isopropylmalate dehydratase small subunit [Desulfarculaceae bacterium]